MSKALVVIPCYNEGKRLWVPSFLQLSKSDLHLLFVNDGSTDNTEKVLEDLAKQNPSRIKTISLTKNEGKSEAVRQGLLEGVKKNYDIVGYIDADLATPASEVLRLVEVLQSTPNLSVVLGSRVRRLGANIERRASRHYLGRIFGTFASLVLGIPIYDSQCGAKFFRSSPSFDFAISTRFSSRWAFDIELLSRLLRPRSSVPAVPLNQFLEVPLKRWKHISGSKLSAKAMLRAFIDLIFIFLSQPGGKISPSNESED